MNKINNQKIKGLLVEFNVKKRQLVELTDEVEEQVFRHAWKTQLDWQKTDGKDEAPIHHLTEEQCREQTLKMFAECFRKWASDNGYRDWADEKPEGWEPGPIISEDPKCWDDWCHVLHEGEEIPEKLKQWFD
jgi:hypothetical protein